MIICSVCLHTVPSDLELCPFCLSEIQADGQENLSEDLHWGIIRTVNTAIEATLIAGRLRANGVPAFVLSQVDSTRNFTVGALAVAKVFVPEEYRRQAEEILAHPVDDFPEDDSGI